MATAALKQTDEPLDTIVRMVTPERIAFHYPLAGPFRRFAAYLFDLFLVLAAVVVVSLVIFVASLGSRSGMGPIYVAYFLLVWGYRGTCEAIFNGQTLGKRILGLRVVTERGVPISGAQAVLRNLVGSLDGTVPYLLRPDLTSMLLLFGLTSMLLTRRFQRLGDLAAGTIVVAEQRRWRSGLIRVNEPAVAALLPWLPLRIEAGPELARALSDYVNHRVRLPRGRREEIARHLARPLSRRYGLPDGAPADIVLCAVYHRVFVGE